MAHNQAADRAWRDSVDAVEAAARDLAPAAFCDPPRPLQVGIHSFLIALFAGQFAEEHVRAFIRRWTATPKYIASVATGEERFDIDGKPAGCIEDAHKYRLRKVYMAGAQLGE
jgi:ProP effector